MGRKIGGAVLLLIAALMMLGFARKGLSLTDPTAFFAVLLTVGLPAIGGITLLRGSLGRNSKTRMNQLRQQTIEAEILKLAAQHRGRLTAVEVTTTLGLSGEDAKASLDEMVRREAADLEVTDDGVLVYTFQNVGYIEGTRNPQGLLDA